MLARPGRSTIEGQRDHAPLSFLYNTGVRIPGSAVCAEAIRFDSPTCVRLYFELVAGHLALTDAGIRSGH
jgi:integrase/recombinase XerC